MYICVKQKIRSREKSNNEVRIVPPVLRGVEAGSELFCELLVNDDEVDCRSFSRGSG